MKKSFLVMICIVFVASVVVVGTLGLKFRNTSHIYTNSIVCNEYYYSGDLNSDSIGENHVFEKKNTEGQNTTVINVSAENFEKGVKVTLLPQAYPEDASIFTGDIQSDYPYVFHTTSDGVTVDEYGVVTFSKPNPNATSITAIIRISPADRSDISTTVVIRVKEIKTNS